MIELPEAVVLAEQINRTLKGKKILSAVANQSPHKFAWYTGDPALYNQRLAGKTIGASVPLGGQVQTQAGDMTLVLSSVLRFYQQGERLPAKHQLLLIFEDGAALVGTIQMWGGLFCAGPGETVGFPDYEIAREKPSPLSDNFTRSYFDSLVNEETPKLSAKQFLATGQRIPGLGNGVLQDILWNARIHPRRKMADIGPRELAGMYDSVRTILKEMADRGGRDTERDLFGNPGGYRTVLSKNTVGTSCQDCGSIIRKEAYMGGSIYYCPGCQKLRRRNK